VPTYDYECKACGHRFETFQGIKDATLKKCPKCGKLKLNRLIGAGAGFLFKGSGFYITDYRSSSYKEKAKSDGGSGGEAAKSSDGAAPPAKKEKADAPAPKPDAKPTAKKDAPASGKPGKKGSGGRSGS
jgi:putative FmdB family regulatory protein